MIRSLLVPLDGSVLAEQALSLALAIALRSGAALHLAHVIDPYHPIYVEGLPVLDESGKPVRELHERAYLQTLANQLESEADTKVSFTLLHGGTADAVAHHAARTGCDFIVMTTHGYGGPARAWLGSTADALVRCSTVPILLLRAEADESNVLLSTLPHRILVPLDGSECSEQILGPARLLGTVAGADYHLLHIVEPVVPAASVYLTYPVYSTGGSVRVAIKNGQAYLKQVAQGLEAQGGTTHTRVVVASLVAQAILDEAEEQKVELIAMSTHGRGGVQGLLLGSVADKVLRGSHVPLLLYRPDLPAQHAADRAAGV